MSKATFRSAFIELNSVSDEGWKARLVSSLGRIATKWALLLTAWASNCTYCLVSLGRLPYPADIPGNMSPGWLRNMESQSVPPAWVSGCF
ncbi:MAG TPA: hypothetical protein VK513_17110 [Terriglobales bacterium]|nr:hypothetical protein [Terriglobales bacterium]